ncbi:MAG: hypothetical protein WCG14_05255 [Chlamydiia bacterium]
MFNPSNPIHRSSTISNESPPLTPRSSAPILQSASSLSSIHESLPSSCNSILHKIIDSLLISAGFVGLKALELLDQMLQFFSREERAEVRPSQPVRTEAANHPGQIKQNPADAANFASLSLFAHEKAIIDELVTCLATADPITLFTSTIGIRKKGQTIDHVHPLKSLQHMLIQPESLHNLSLLQKRASGLIWEHFKRDLTERLKRQHREGQLIRFINDFAASLDITPPILHLSIEEGKWDELTQTVVNHSIERAQSIAASSNSSHRSGDEQSLIGDECSTEQDPVDFSIDQDNKNKLTYMLRYYSSNKLLFLSRTQTLTQVHPLRLILEIFEDPSNFTLFTKIMEDPSKRSKFLEAFPKILKSASENGEHNLSKYTTKFADQMRIKPQVVEADILTAGNTSWKNLIKAVYRNKQEQPSLETL